MSNETNNYTIIPNKINPKLGLVVPDISYKKPKSMYGHPDERRKYHIKNHRQGFEAIIFKDFPLTYRMKCTHLFHYLQYELIMKVRNEVEGGLSLVCDFYPIDVEVMNKFFDEDDFLHGILLIHFQMHIMYHLLIFCEKNNFESLIINVENHYVDALEIYESIVSFINESTINKNKMMMMMIDTKKISPDRWKIKMKNTFLELQKEMWEEAKTNYTVKEYIKLNPFLDVFC